MNRQRMRFLSIIKFVDFLVSQYAVQRRAVLVVDEAQALDARQTETLRMLANVNNEKNPICFRLF